MCVIIALVIHNELRIKYYCYFSHQSRNLHYFSFTLADKDVAYHCYKLLQISFHVINNNQLQDIMMKKITYKSHLQLVLFDLMKTHI